MNEALEFIMLVCFGVSWPINAVKHWRAGTAKSMSLTFLILILVGYIAGIAAKIIVPPKHAYVLVIYIINLCSVTANLIIYFRNRRRDAMQERQ